MVSMAYLAYVERLACFAYFDLEFVLMATLKELRIRARLSAEALGRKANVAGKTVKRAERGLPVQDVKAAAIVEALGEALGQQLRIEDVDGLRIHSGT